MKVKSTSNCRFMTYWVVGHAMIAMIASNVWLFVLPATQTIGLALEASIWLALISLQYFIMPRSWRPAVNRWLFGSLTAWLVGALIVQSLAFDIGISERLLLYPVYFLPIGVIQAWILRNRFSKAWLWIITLLLSAVTQALLENAVLNDAWITNMLSFPIQTLTIAIHTVIPTVQAVVTGWMLIYMSQSLKHDENILSDEAQQSRLERLQDGQFTEPLSSSLSPKSEFLSST